MKKLCICGIMGNCVHGTKSNEAFLFLREFMLYEIKLHIHQWRSRISMHINNKNCSILHNRQFIHKITSKRGEKQHSQKWICMCIYNVWQQQQFGSCDFRKVGFHICFILIIDMNAFAHSCLRAQYDHSIIKFHPEFTTFRFCFCFLPYIFVYLHFVVHV